MGSPIPITIIPILIPFHSSLMSLFSISLPIPICVAPAPAIFLEKGVSKRSHISRYPGITHFLQDFFLLRWLLIFSLCHLGTSKVGSPTPRWVFHLGTEAYADSRSFAWMMGLFRIASLPCSRLLSSLCVHARLCVWWNLQNKLNNCTSWPPHYYGWHYSLVDILIFTPSLYSTLLREPEANQAPQAPPKLGAPLCKFQFLEKNPG